MYCLTENTERYCSIGWRNLKLYFALILCQSLFLGNAEYRLLLLLHTSVLRTPTPHTNETVDGLFNLPVQILLFKMYFVCWLDFYKALTVITFCMRWVFPLKDRTIEVQNTVSFCYSKPVIDVILVFTLIVTHNPFILGVLVLLCLINRHNVLCCKGMHCLFHMLYLVFFFLYIDLTALLEMKTFFNCILGRLYFVYGWLVC